MTEEGPVAVFAGVADELMSDLGSPRPELSGFRTLFSAELRDRLISAWKHREQRGWSRRQAATPANLEIALC